MHRFPHLFEPYKINSFSVFLSDLNLGGLYKTALKSLDFQQQLAVLSEAIQQHAKKPLMLTNLAG
ncbi:MAG: hypothetical protein DRH21_03205 [Deltaproteobacteria bacterium]|nr:MAG: hypothetical protein DRH21_03205 [Deltaproteobacteria bacterium]